MGAEAGGKAARDRLCGDPHFLTSRTLGSQLHCPRPREAVLSPPDDRAF